MVIEADGVLGMVPPGCSASPGTKRLTRDTSLWLVSEQNNPPVERFAADQLQARRLHPGFEKALARAHNNRLHQEAELVDEVSLHQRLDQGRATHDHNVPPWLLFQPGDRLGGI